MKISRPLLLLALALAQAAPAADSGKSNSENRPPKNPWIIPTEHGPDVVGGSAAEKPAPDPARPAGSAGNSAPATWTTDYAAALARAAAERKQVLLNFTGSDWCSWCKKLTVDVFNQPEFQRQAAARFVLVTVDFPRNRRLPPAEVAQNAQLQRRFNVTGFPTLLVVDANGQKLAAISGYVRGGSKGFFAALDQQMKR